MTEYTEQLVSDEIKLPESDHLVGFATRAMEDEEFREQIESYLESDDWRCRAGALRVITRMIRKDASSFSNVPGVVKLVSDKHRIVRNHAHVVFFELARKDPSATEPAKEVFSSLLDNSDAYDRFDAVHILHGLRTVAPEFVAGYESKLRDLAENDENHLVKLEASKFL